VVGPIFVRMFVQSVGADGQDLDPRDVPAVPTSGLWRSNRDRFGAVLNARPAQLVETDQLRLLAEATACVAVLEWTRCTTASSLAIKDLSSPLVAAATARTGGAQLLQVGGVGTPRVCEGIITELGLAMSVSEPAARDYLAVGLDLRFRLRCTSNEFGGGRISYAHAKVISQATRHLAEDVAERLDARLADAATTRTPARLRILARRLAATADPAALARRHQLAMQARTASIFALGDGMACFSLNHQLDVAAVIDHHLNTWARRRRIADPTTGHAAHKADAATLLLLGRHPLTGTALIPTAPATTPPAASVTEDDATAAQTAARSHPVPISTVTPARPGDLLATRTELRVTMGADTLLGIDDATCQLDGYGPITANQARHLALHSASVLLRRVFTDPINHAIMTLDAHSYRFTKAQTEAITTLHPISCFPGATTPAQHCDLDHPTPYQHGPPGQPDPPGQTTLTNALPTGRRHHRHKTHLGWTPTPHPNDPHTITWTSPHGLTYTVHDHDGA
jgi:hypothetical protein